jgi:hypothetical protein
MGSMAQGAFAAEATGVWQSRREEVQIRAAIREATGTRATDGQTQCMSREIHECKRQGEGGSKNEKGDFTFQELVEMAKDLFGKP